MTRIRSLATILSALALTACGEEAAQTITAPLAGASVKFFNFGINAPAVNFFSDDAKVTAISSTSCTPANDPRCSTTGIESTNGTAYGAAGAGALYGSVPGGQHTFSARIAAATDNGLAITSLPAAVADGKFYSYYVSGFYNTTTKTADAFMVEDPIPATFDFTVSYVRFVNASPNAAPLTLYVKDWLDSTRPEITVGGAVPYKGAGDFVAVPSGQYELFARTTGSSTNAITRNGTLVVTLNPGRTYTVTARGDMTVTSSTATNRPFLDLTANR